MATSRYALVAERLWDGISDSPREGTVVIVNGAQIESVAPLGDLPTDIPRVDLAGCTLIPGLIDAHVHYSTVMGPAFLAAGVTTIRDVGNDLEWILNQRTLHEEYPLSGPTIVCCGALQDGPDAYWKRIGRPHADAELLRASIQRHVALGVDQIKLYASMDLGLLSAGVDEAHRLGKYVLAHLGRTAVEDAAHAGLDELEHLDQCSVAWRSATQAEDDGLIALLLEHNVVIDPTLVVWDRLGRILERSFHHDQRRQWVHPCHVDIWNRYLSRFDPPQNRLRFQTAMPHLKRFLLRAHEQSVTVALGTDTPFPHLVPGFSVHDELAMYVDAGIRPVDALRSATSINARVLGVESRVGQIAPGLIADLVAVKGNPLKNIDDISNSTHVVHAGRAVDPEEMLRAVQMTFARQPDDPITNDLLGYVNQSH